MHGKSEQSGNTTAVWDVSVRLFHWALAASVLAAFALGIAAPKRLLDWHLYAGYSALALVTFRVIWGFSGPTFARFRAFPPSLRAALSHVRGAHPSGYGHNPLGALMVYALLGLVAVLALSGVWTLGGVVRQGPLAAFTTYTNGRTAKDIHEIIAWIIIAMAGLHVGGVIFESWREKENLARSMVTGRKRVRNDATPNRAMRPLAAALSVVVIAAAAAFAFVWASGRPAPFIPSGPVLAEWKTECSACHTAHHPSLLPAAAWTAVMAGLGDHFGEDASLNAETTAKIGEWLAANSAEKFDTRPANSFRQADAAEPLRITATARWKRIHDDIAAETFKQKGIGSAANCGACHADAETGLFAPQKIFIPQVPKENP